MSPVAEENVKVVKPKIICGLDGCVKEYPKSYMKTHQRSTIHNPDPDTIAEAVIEAVDENDEALSGGTQELVNTVVASEVDKALEAENEVFTSLVTYWRVTSTLSLW